MADTKAPGRLRDREALSMKNWFMTMTIYLFTKSKEKTA